MYSSRTSRRQKPHDLVFGAISTTITGTASRFASRVVFWRVIFQLLSSQGSTFGENCGNRRCGATKGAAAAEHTDRIEILQIPASNVLNISIVVKKRPGCSRSLNSGIRGQRRCLTGYGCRAILRRRSCNVTLYSIHSISKIKSERA